MTGETAFVEKLRALATHPAARGLKDDAAVLDLGKETLVLTHDMMVEGVHYLPEQRPEDIAWKLVAVNLSDLAAKGAKPVGVLLGHMLGVEDNRFIAGLKEVLDRFDTALLGGDTVFASGPSSHGLTAIGRATHRPVPSRAGAMPGDKICVTGPIGAAMTGFEIISAKRDDSTQATLAFRRPVPLLVEGARLAPHVSAMMDISDGLLLDAQRMAMASQVTIAIDTAAVPLACDKSRRSDALRWGEDYQLLLAAPPESELPVPLHRIGTVLSRQANPLLIDGLSPAPDDPLGYSHNRAA